jgi:hypothetical protein
MVVTSAAREVLEHRLVGVPAREHPLVDARRGLDAVEVLIAVERADRLQTQRDRTLAETCRSALDRDQRRQVAGAQPAEESSEVLDRRRIPGELVDGQELPPQRQRSGIRLHRVRRATQHPQILQKLLRGLGNTMIAIQHGPGMLAVRQHHALGSARARRASQGQAGHWGGASCRARRTYSAPTEKLLHRRESARGHWGQRAHLTPGSPQALGRRVRAFRAEHGSRPPWPRCSSWMQSRSLMTHRSHPDERPRCCSTPIAAVQRRRRAWLLERQTGHGGGYQTAAWRNPPRVGA